MSGRQLRSLFWPACATLAALAVLVALGVWQLHRLAWKEGLLADIRARARAVPQHAPARATWPVLSSSDYEYRHISLAGTFETAKETLVFRSTEAGPGYLVMTPLKLDDGGTIIVNRGWVPTDLKDKATRVSGEPKGHTVVTGLMRAPEARNLFTPPDQPDKGEFFTKDPQTIAAHDALGDAAPFIVDADATPNPGGWPHGGATVTAIPNNHLSYALTWFGLALGLLGVFTSFAWKRLADDPRKDRRPVDSDGREVQSLS